MSRLSPEPQTQLSDQFGERVTFDKTERKLYSHDVGSMPKLIHPLLGSTLADGVVQPLSEEKLVWMARWASDNSVPLTPRGKATSG